MTPADEEVLLRAHAARCIKWDFVKNFVPDPGLKTEAAYRAMFYKLCTRPGSSP